MHKKQLRLPVIHYSQRLLIGKSREVCIFSAGKGLHLVNFVKFFQDALSADHLRETDSLCIEVLAEHVKAFRISRSDPKT